jgi:hypothetical protein
VALQRLISLPRIHAQNRKQKRRQRQRRLRQRRVHRRLQFISRGRGIAAELIGGPVLQKIAILFQILAARGLTQRSPILLTKLGAKLVELEKCIVTGNLNEDKVPPKERKVVGHAETLTHSRWQQDQVRTVEVRTSRGGERKQK